MHGDGGEWREGERRTKTTTKQKRKKKGEWGGGRKPSEVGLLLSSLPSIRCQQGRSTTVASQGAQKSLTSVFELMESRVDRRLLTAPAPPGTASPRLELAAPSHRIQPARAAQRHQQWQKSQPVNTLVNSPARVRPTLWCRDPGFFNAGGT